MLYTSYFGNLRKIPEGYKTVAICAKAPDWYTGAVYKKLAPTYDIFMDYKNTGDSVKFMADYKSEVLSKLNPLEVVNELQTLAEGNDIVLLCYEKSGEFCHRNIVAEWLTAGGFYCKEL